MAIKFKHDVSEGGWIYFSKRLSIKEFVTNLVQVKSSFGLNVNDALYLKNPPCEPCQIARISVVTDIMDEYEPVIRLYPNPASSEINIDFVLPRKEENLLTIVDMMGRTVVQMTIANGTTIDINHLSDGVYTIIITNNSGKWFNKFLVKK